ncbi:MAG: sugar phosphate isomerase/epimerase [Oscillospiraceae bacterium]|nr:sugar phosphate isomerase/epimerase [Oscillospiraceae bacterium]
MKIGCCLSFKDEERIKLGKALGLEFMETALVSLSQANSEEIAQFAEFLHEIDFKCPAANLMFPGDMRLTGPEADFKKAEDYLYRTFENVKKVGIKVIVFGSGGARRVPEGFSIEAATEQLVELCSDYISPVMEKYDVVCGIEELLKRSCNILNNCKEAMDVVYKVNKPSIKLLADLFHIGMENEPVESLADYKGYIAHVHISSPKNNGAFPRDGDGEDYKLFFDMLRKTGYGEGLVSIEGNDGGNFEAAVVETLRCLKKI